MKTSIFKVTDFFSSQNARVLPYYPFSVFSDTIFHRGFSKWHHCACEWRRVDQAEKDDSIGSPSFLPCDVQDLSAVVRLLH